MLAGGYARSLVSPMQSSRLVTCGAEAALAWPMPVAVRPGPSSPFEGIPGSLRHECGDNKCVRCRGLGLDLTNSHPGMPRALGRYRKPGNPGLTPAETGLFTKGLTWTQGTRESGSLKKRTGACEKIMRSAARAEGEAMFLFSLSGGLAYAVIATAAVSADEIHG